MAQLQRTLTLTQVSFFGVGVILGAGIYTIIGKSAGLGGNMLWVSFLIAAFAAALTALSYAELSAMFPKAGGEFVYLGHAMGKRMAWIIGFVVIASGVVSAATIAIGFAGYFNDLIEFNKTIIALAIIGAMLAVNIIGVRQSAVLTIVFTIIEVAGLIYVIAAGWNKLGSIDYFEAPSSGLFGILSGAALSFFAFKGFENIVKLSEETVKPEKNIPRALLISGSVVTVLYLAVVFAAISAVSPAELEGSSSPLSTIVSQRFGKSGAVIIGIIALFSTTNTLLSSILGSSRIFYSISKESARLKFFARVSSERKTPIPALICIAIAAGLFALTGDLKNAAMVTNVLVFITCILVNAAVIVLRYREADTKRPFRIPLSAGKLPLLTAMAIAMNVLLLTITVIGLFNNTLAGDE